MNSSTINNFTSFFQSEDKFNDNEWILQHQIFALLLVSFWLGIGVFFFGIYRISEGNFFVGIVQLLYALFLVVGFRELKKNKKSYPLYSVLYFILFFIYTHIVFFYVPQNHLNILWIVVAPVLIFFFLDKKGGIAIFILLLGFIAYLLITNYPYTKAEYITLFAALSTTSLIMYAYEKVKEAEKKRLLAYNQRLQKSIELKTKKLQDLNKKLEQKVAIEVEKRITQEQMLLRQNRMACMGEMIDSIAHQWRQPLMSINTILLNINRATKDCSKKEYIDTKIDNIFTLTRHMSNTIEDFRNLLKDGKDKKEFSLKETIDSVLVLMKSNLKRVEVELKVLKDSQIKSFQSELSQVFIVIFSNAIDIFKLRDIKRAKLEITINKIDGVSIVEIIDNAGGIEPKIVDKIFDPYFTTKEQLGGTGLGLYISKIIIEDSIGGSIKVENIDNGASFLIKI